MNRHLLPLTAFFILLIPALLTAQPVAPTLVLQNPKTLVQLHQRVVFKAGGDIAQEILTEWAKMEEARHIHLVIDGIIMTDLPPYLTMPLQEDGSLELSFTLMRDPQNEKSRQAWELLLDNTKVTETEYEKPVSLQVGDKPPRLAEGKLKFALNDGFKLRMIIGLSLLLFLGLSIWVGVKSNMLRDGSVEGAPYSLSRFQIAFWGLLVFCAWVGTSVTTGSMEYVPDEILILLGISVSTSLGAVLIDNSKDLDARRRAVVIAERDQLQQKISAQGNAPIQADVDRLTQLAHEIARFPSSVAQSFRPSAFLGFIHDLCNDGHGLSFHRLQMLLWTLALGGFFAWRVMDTVSFPVIPKELLILMGISNGTYVGMKWPEKA